MACTASSLSARDKLWCKSLEKLILEKKEMKYCRGFVMTKLAAQDHPDLPDGIFLMYPKGEQDQGRFLDCLFQGP